MRGMNAYLAAKHVHQATVVITLTLFILRGAWMLADSPNLKRTWVKVLPHVNDTVLLVSALYMAFLIGPQPWIIAKVVGLVLYVILGTIALKRGRTKAVRTGAFAAALLVFGYVVAVAVTKRVLPV
jgi:uncharacterized membrane protein SirB2